MSHQHSYQYKTENHSEENKIFEDGIWKIVKECWTTTWEECSCGAKQNKIDGPKFRC